MKFVLLLFELLLLVSPVQSSSWQMVECATPAQVLKILNGKNTPTEFCLTTRAIAARTVVFQVFYRSDAPTTISPSWQVRKVMTLAAALDFVNSQGAFAKMPEKEFHICGDAGATPTPAFWIFYRKYEGRTPEAAKGQWNWKGETFDRAESVQSFLMRRRDQEWLTDAAITGAGDKFYIFYRAPRLYDAPGMPIPVWHWLKRENTTGLLEVLNTGFGQPKQVIRNARIAVLGQPGREVFYLFY